MQVTPGEGERRAQRGYTWQYRVAAKLIFDAIASGELQWIGVADRQAGKFDDLVLGLNERVVAYQFKSSRIPESFSIRTLLLGASSVWRLILEARSKLIPASNGLTVETIFVTADFPSDVDNIGDTDSPVSSAAFLRMYGAKRVEWSISEWFSSPFRSFVEEVQAATPAGEFEHAWRCSLFHTDVRPPERYSDRRIEDVAHLLPALVADPLNKDRWTIKELLGRLNWSDPFGLLHSHAFPVDQLYQANVATEAQLKANLFKVTRGYLSLVGPPGSGKSTLLAAGILPTPRAAIIRYLAFVPTEGQGLGRAEAKDFLEDLIKQFKQQQLGAEIIPSKEVHELRRQLEQVLLEASQRFKQRGIRSIIVVDGLDHVPREERPERSFLRELPTPSSLPEGVIILLGTQKLDLDDLPPAVRDEAAGDGRQVIISPLTREAVAQILASSGMPSDVSIHDLYSKVLGHPLSTRYVIESLLKAHSADERSFLLQAGPVYQGDIEAFYRSAWHAIEHDSRAQEVLAYVALADGPISPIGLDSIVGSSATDAAFRAGGQFLVRDANNAWSIFHNSFRLFIRRMTGMRHGISDEAAVLRRYENLAKMTKSLAEGDPQRWMTLRYYARSKRHEIVAEIATNSQYFRSQFYEGRDPSDILDDIRFAHGAAKILRRPDLLFTLVLTANEIAMRADVIGAECFRAHLELSQYDEARRILTAGEVALPVGIGFELVDRYMAVGRFDEARALFQILEPIDALYGAELVDTFQDNSELHEWARRALIFRDFDQFNACIERIQVPEKDSFHFVDIEEYKVELKLTSAIAQLQRKPTLSVGQLAKSLGLTARQTATLYVHAASALHENGDLSATHAALLEAQANADQLTEDALRVAVAVSIGCDDLPLADTFFQRLSTPSIERIDRFSSVPDYAGAVADVIEYYRQVARLGYEFDAVSVDSPNINATLQSLLQKIGYLSGEAQAGYDLSWDLEQTAKDALRLLAIGQGDHEEHYDQWKIDGAIGTVMGSLIQLGNQVSDLMRDQIIGLVDRMTELDRSRFRRSEIRRKFAVLAFQFDRDTAVAKRRIDYHPNSETSPELELSEGAETAIAYSKVGLKQEAKRILNSAFVAAVGYSRPARKDPQYILWRELFDRACTVDPEERARRIEFMARFLSGLAETEGRSAGSRVADAFVQQSVRNGSASADAAADLIEKTALLDWHDLAAAITVAAAASAPQVAAAAALIYGRLALATGGEHSNCRYDEIIPAIPRTAVPSVGNHIIQCIETDCHPDRKLLALESAVGALASHGFTFGQSEFARWKSELPLPKSGSSPEDPFFHNRTLSDIDACLKSEGNGSFGASRAFERIAPKARFQEAKVLFEKHQELRSDERAVAAIAKSAIANGSLPEAEIYLSILKARADEHGGWGGWGYSSKMRYHEIDVAIYGEEARERTFQSVANDLEQGRESGKNILPEIVNILDLISPAPNWKLLWDALESHLRHFREYSIGTEHSIVSGEVDCASTLSSLLHRAISLTTIHHSQMVHLVAVELLNVESGPEIVSDLIRRLWRAGYGNDAAQIAWNCRDSDIVAKRCASLTPEIANSRDIACQHIGINLGTLWGSELGLQEKVIPAFYSLHVPDSPFSDVYRPPTGFSARSSGLVPTDPYGRTWPLKSAIQITARASGIDEHKLRLRAASFMERNGKAELFSLVAQKAQLTRLRHLDLHISYHKLDIAAAFSAMREVIGELFTAGALDPDALPLLLWLTGGYSSGLAKFNPVPRPHSFNAPAIRDDYQRDYPDRWIADVCLDLEKPNMDGYEIIAASAIHKHHRHAEEWKIEQYYGPALTKHGSDLLAHYSGLPECIIYDQVIPLYRDQAKDGVAHIDAYASGSVVGGALTLCPIVAQQVGWHASEDNALVYLDNSGAVAAKTIFWRDGGLQTASYDQAVFRKGFALLVHDERLEDIRAFLPKEVQSIAWRRISGEHPKSASKSRIHAVSAVR